MERRHTGIEQVDFRLGCFAENCCPFYRSRALYNRIFTTKDYFWPISLDELRRNPKLKQNVGW
nr:RagB/SusD family nutrient uptake outer membrane protein [Niabella hibiscisoli]